MTWAWGTSLQMRGALGEDSRFLAGHCERSILWQRRDLLDLFFFFSFFKEFASCLFSCSSLDGPVCIGWASWFSTKGHVPLCCFMGLRLGAPVRAFCWVKSVGVFSSSQWNVIFHFSSCSCHVCVHCNASWSEILRFFSTPGGSGQSYSSSETSFECKGL